VDKIEDVTGFTSRETFVQQETVLSCHNLLKRYRQGKNHVQKK
jgi:hypothetical protein